MKVVLFDLDGTLLPLDQDKFVKAYFLGLSKKLAHYGYNTDLLTKAVWQGTDAMIHNDGAATNEEVFWKTASSILGEKVLEDKKHFDDFYANEFGLIKDECGFNPEANETVKQLKRLGYRVAVATNPVFPHIATYSRLCWAGIDVSDVEFFTTYEDSHFCKPNLDYYREVLNRLNVSAQDCLMVGNDVDEDMVARELGMSVFLLSDCLLNRHNKDISVYPQGSFTELMKYIKEAK